MKETSAEIKSFLTPLRIAKLGKLFFVSCEWFQVTYLSNFLHAFPNKIEKPS